MKIITFICIQGFNVVFCTRSRMIKINIFLLRKGFLKHGKYVSKCYLSSEVLEFVRSSALSIIHETFE